MLKKLFTRVHFYSWHVPHKIPIFFFLQLNALPQYSLLFWYFPLNELRCFCVQRRSDAGAHLNAKLLATLSYGIIEFPFPITKPCPCHLPFWVSDLEVSWQQCLMRFSNKKCNVATGRFVTWSVMTCGFVAALNQTSKCEEWNGLNPLDYV